MVWWWLWGKTVDPNPGAWEVLADKGAVLGVSSETGVSNSCVLRLQGGELGGGGGQVARG